MEVVVMQKIANMVEMMDHNSESAYENLSRDILVDRMMSAGQRADERMTRVFSEVYQKLLNEEDTKRVILDSISVPTALACQIIEYVAYDVD